jgi:glutaredoxin
MTARILFFTQPGCLSCELMRVFLQANEVAFEEHDISSDFEARRQMTEHHGSRETPTLVILALGVEQVIVGFDPARLDQLLAHAPSSDAVTEP